MRIAETATSLAGLLAPKELMKALQKAGLNIEENDEMPNMNLARSVLQNG